MEHRGYVLSSGLLLLLSFSAAAATELHCFVGEVCNQWRNDEEAEHGILKGKDVCCPPEPHQGMTFIREPPELEDCRCEAGTAEKYANVGNSASTSASVLGPLPLVFVMMVLLKLLVQFFCD